jgi:hypothetical protein
MSPAGPLPLRAGCACLRIREPGEVVKDAFDSAMESMAETDGLASVSFTSAPLRAVTDLLDIAKDFRNAVRRRCQRRCVKTFQSRRSI